MIEGVLFDLRDTLLDISSGYQESDRFLHNFVLSYGINIKPEQLQTDLTKVRKSIIATMGNDPSVHNWDAIFLDALFKDYGLNLTGNQFPLLLDRYASIFASNVSLYPDAKKLLAELRRREIKIGVVIDGTISRETLILYRTGLSELMDVITISEEVGQNKFSDLPLTDALGKLKVPPPNVLVIGDRIDKDIIHANKAGCVSVKLKRPGGRYTDVSALSAEEKPKYIIHSLELNEVRPLLIA